MSGYQELTTVEKAASYDQLMPLLNAMHIEFREAARKKAEAVLSKKKVCIVNRLLTDVLVIIDGEQQRQYLDMLDEDDLPQNGDVSLILGQVVAAMEAFHEKYYVYIRAIGEKAWATPETFDVVDEPDDLNE